MVQSTNNNEQKALIPHFITYKNAEKNKWYAFSSSFNIDKKATLTIACGNYAEIYINSKFAFRLCEKFYIFDLYYKVIDITKYLIPNNNTITILYSSTGDLTHDGIYFNIKDESNIVLEADKNIKSGVFKPYKNGTPFFLENGAKQELYNAKYEQFIDEYAQDNKKTIVIDRKNTKFDNVHLSNISFPCEEKITGTILPTFSLIKNKEAYHISNPNEKTYGIYYSYIQAGKNVFSYLYFSNQVKYCYYNDKEIKTNTKIKIESDKNILIFIGSPFDFTFSNANKIKQSDFIFIPLDMPVREKPFFPWNDPVFEFNYTLPDIYKLIDENNNQIKCTLEQANEQFILSTSKYSYNGSKKSIQNIGNLYSKNKLLPSSNEEIKVCNNRKNYATIIDFKKEVIGTFYFDCFGHDNNEVYLYFFERLDEDGIKFLPERNSAKIIISKKITSYSTHVRRGFRYALIICSSKDILIKNICANKLSYPIKNKYSFTTDNSKLNQIYNMCVDSAESCTIDMYIDCPGYEQNPWTGDAYITSLINLYNFGNYDMDKHYHNTIALSVSDGLTKYYRTNNPRYINKKFLPCAAFPTYPEGNIPIWSFMWMLNVSDSFLCTGDYNFIQSIIPSIETTLTRCESMLSKRNLLSIDGAWNLIEWANNDLLMCGEITANNILLYACYSKYAYIEELLGNNKLASHYNSMARIIKIAINKYCYDKNKKAYTDMVRDEYGYELYSNYFKSINRTPVGYEEYLSLNKISVQTNTLAMFYDVTTNKQSLKLKKLLTKNIDKGNYIPGTPSNYNLCKTNPNLLPNGYVHIGSPFFLFYAYNQLIKLCEYDILSKSIFRDYGYLLDNNITTTVETFSVKGFPKPRSDCHAWSASFGVFAKSFILGIKPLSPGFSTFTIKPNLLNLNSASGSVPTPFGDIYVKITKNAFGLYDIEYTCPKECKIKDMKKFDNYINI